MKKEKKEKMLRLLGNIDDVYVAEADPDTKSPRAARRPRTLRAALIAAAILALAVPLCLWLFLPFSSSPPDVSRYADSAYYELIGKLSNFNFHPSPYKNNFVKLISAVEQIGAKNATDGAPVSGLPVGSYAETTDNQVADVIEGDLIKRSDTRVYYLDEEKLTVYSIDGESSAPLGSYALPQDGTLCAREIYLSADCLRVTLIRSYHTFSRSDRGDRAYFTDLTLLDVSDPAAIRELRRVAVSGRFLSSRLTDAGLLLTASYTQTSENYAKPDGFVPSVDGSVLPPERICCPEELNVSAYTVLCLLAPDTLDVLDEYACLSVEEADYVSADSVYLAREYRKEMTEETMTKGTYTEIRHHNVWNTEIRRVGYADGKLTDRGAVTLPGVNRATDPQYCYDEKDGVLRLVLTGQETKWTELLFADGGSSGFTDSSSVNPILYCVDTEKMEVISSLTGFAPEGETVRSARFSGDTAYVCTSVQSTDPVFIFDLSDPAHVTWTDTGVIPGFSASLVNYPDGIALGMGISGDRSSIKIDLYREEDGTVRTLDSRLFPYYDVSFAHKSHLVDREEGLFGFAYQGTDTLLYYNVLTTSGGSLQLLKEVTIPYGSSPRLRSVADVRCLYIDGFFYLFTPWKGLQVFR